MPNFVTPNLVGKAWQASGKSLSHTLSINKREMKVSELERMINEQERPIDEYAVSAAFPALMRKVYVWMTLALAITGLTAWGIASSPGLVYSIVSNTALLWGLLIAEIVLVVWLSVRLTKLSLTAATLIFIAYSVLNGVTMSFIFLAYTATSIAQTFFVSAATFGVMAVFGTTTRRNLQGWGRYFFMALIGLIIAMVVNLFVGGAMLDFVISGVGVILFTAITAYDAQAIRMMLALEPDLGEGSQKVALYGALDLYLDFINLFLYLLRFLGNRNS